MPGLTQWRPRAVGAVHRRAVLLRLSDGGVYQVTYGWSYEITA